MFTIGLVGRKLQFNQPSVAISNPPFARKTERVPPAEMARAIAELARLQAGMVSRRQLIALGMAPATVAKWNSRGGLHRVADGVYAVGYEHRTREGQWAAALLFAGSSSCLSHRTALCLWGIDRGPGRIEVIRDFNRANPRVANSRDTWLTIHRTRRLPEQDLTRRRGFPVTTVARALLDTTPRLTDTQLRKFLAAADRKGIANRAEFHDILERRQGCRGILRLRKAVEQWDPLVRITKSDLESWFLDLRKKYEIPEPEVNAEIGEFEVDCFWRERKVIVELDTYTYHGDTFSFEGDHSRDLILEGRGYRVHRITALMLEEREAFVMQTLRDLLGR